MMTFSRIFAVLILSCSAMAATILVDPSGAGDHTTINGALAASVSGDIIQIMPGVYPEFIDITHSITLDAVGGRPSVTIDGESIRRIMNIGGQIDVTLRGLRFARAHGVDPSALLIWQQATVLVDDCEFVDNVTIGSNAVHVRHLGTSATFVACDFVRNSCSVHSAALSLSNDAYVLLDDCMIADNTSLGNCGAVNTLGAHLDVMGCLFLRNSSPAGAGALLYQSSVGVVSGNTFNDNSGPGSGSVRLDYFVTFTHNIVTSDRGGAGLTLNTTVIRSCNLYYDNADGPVEDESLGELEINADPLYCDYTVDDYQLCMISPALPGVGGCGIIGAFGQGCANCGPIPNENMNWGDLKRSFR